MPVVETVEVVQERVPDEGLSPATCSAGTHMRTHSDHRAKSSATNTAKHIPPNRQTGHPNHPCRPANTVQIAGM